MTEPRPTAMKMSPVIGKMIGRGWGGAGGDGGGVDGGDGGGGGRGVDCGGMERSAFC